MAEHDPPEWARGRWRGRLPGLHVALCSSLYVASVPFHSRTSQDTGAIGSAAFVAVKIHPSTTMAVLKHDAWVLLTARLTTLCLAVGASSAYTYQPSYEFHATAPSLLPLALGCLITACAVEVVGQVVSLVRGQGPVPSDRLLLFSLFFVDLVLGVFTFASASATVAVADFAMRARMLVQPTVGQLFLHGGLAFAAGLSCLFTTFYHFLPVFRPPPPPPPPQPQE